MSATVATNSAEEKQRVALVARTTTRKVARRLLPVLFVLYIASFLDRTNVSLAALQMNHGLGLNTAVYGLGSGIFFIGYALFELPSNLALARVGARRWIARIAVTWGILACAMAFVSGSRSFYLVRFLLGAAEAGCFPGIIYFLSQWFPERDRARALSRFMVGIPLAGVIGGPVGGALLSLDGHLGLAGWQWLFLVEGIPAVLLGIVVWFVLTDRPEDATWLAPEERNWLMGQLASEARNRAATSEASVRRALSGRMVWWLSLVYLLVIASELGPIFFGPILVADALHLSSFGVGMVMGATSLVGVIAMLLNGAHSDRSGERIAHTAVPMLVVTLGFIVTATVHHPAGVIAGLALIALGVNAVLPVFWCVPSALLRGSAAAGGIAIINSIGNLGGFLAPSVLGTGKEATGSYTGGLLTLGALALLAALFMLPVGRARGLAQPRFDPKAT